LKFYRVGVSGRCYLIHALAPEGTSASAANEELNEYVADARRGIAVWHDHFVGEHGGAAVLDVRSDEEHALLDDPGPLAGWRLSVHPLTFSLTAVGFVAQGALTLEEYRGLTHSELVASEPDDPRYWWRRKNT
jgi:hypothetical protein